MIEIPFQSLNKVFWVNRIGIENDLASFLQLYKKLDKNMLNDNNLLIEAVNSAQIEGARTTYADTLKIVEGNAKIKNKSEKMVVNIKI
ncbi:MAG TPA: hypothetical protein VIL05_06510 [Thermoclostridium sp.]